MKEEIRMIPWTNGRYGVSNIGNVYSYYHHHGPRKEPKLLNKKIIQGYVCVHLYVNRKRKKYRVHRLVAITFIPNPNNLPFINHKNEIKADNRVENLEWCTMEYNNNYGNHRLNVAEAAEKLRKPFVQLDSDGNIIRRFETHKEAALYFKKGSSGICRMLNGRSKNKLNLHYI